MATGKQAVDRIAEVTGFLPATVMRAARILREADRDLWPEAGKGGGKSAAHVQPHHLVNLVLALAVDPLTDAPNIVARLRDCVPSHDARQGHFDTMGKWMDGDTLGEALDEIVTKGDPKAIARSAIIEECTGFNIELVRAGSEPPSVTATATVRITLPKNPLEDPAALPRSVNQPVICFYSPKQGELIAGKRNPFTTHMVKTTNIPSEIFATLIELWRDTQDVRGRTAASAASQNKGRDMIDAQTVPLTDLPRALAELTGEPPPSYRSLYGMVVDGRLPAGRVNGRYRINRRDLPAIAEAVGLIFPAAVAE